MLIHVIYKRYYKKQKQKLVEMNQRQVSRLQLENDKVIMKMRNDKLRHEIESKTRELSVSTMSIIKKNELLETIKKELLSLKNDSKIIAS